MIVRLVRMQVRPGDRDTFISIFESNKAGIRNFPGCTHLELLEDVKQRGTITTLSYWESEAVLEAYRKSDLFGTVWSQVKKLFAARTEAHTYERVMSA